MLNKAIKLAAEYHIGTDKQGKPYILHPLSVMHKVEGEKEKVVAVLHYLVEDTSITISFLREQGFPEDILEAVYAITGKWGEWYWDAILRCKDNELARKVKLADLEHNFNLPRTICRPDDLEQDINRLKKYALSWHFLSGNLTREEYLDSLAPYSIR